MITTPRRLKLTWPADASAVPMAMNTTDPTNRHTGLSSPAMNRASMVITGSKACSNNKGSSSAEKDRGPGARGRPQAAQQDHWCDHVLQLTHSRTLSICTNATVRYRYAWFPKCRHSAMQKPTGRMLVRKNSGVTRFLGSTTWNTWQQA